MSSPTPPPSASASPSSNSGRAPATSQSAMPAESQRLVATELPLPKSHLKIAPDDTSGSQNRWAWVPGFAAALLPIVGWGTALIFMFSFGALMIALGDRGTRITGVLIVILAVLISGSGSTLAFLMWRRRVALRTLQAAHHSIRDGQEEAAIAKLRQLLADGKLPEIRHLIRFMLGRALQKAGRDAEAIDAYRRCGRFWPAFHNIGIIQLDAGNLEKAEAAFKVALSFNPREPLIFNHLALVQQRRGEPILARDTLERGLKSAPASKATKRNLDRLDAREPLEVDGIFPRLRSIWRG